MEKKIKKILRFVNYYRYALISLLNNPFLNERQQPVYINFVIHTEKISYSEVYKSFLNFLKRFYHYTSVKPTCCITTPLCPLTRKEMEQLGVKEEEYISRVRKLSRYAEIGYHGHFFESEKENKLKKNIQCDLRPIIDSNYDFESIRLQMESEIRWLHKIEVEPKVYVAGWWFMRKEIALLLQEYKFIVDCSLRKHHSNTFGGKYLEDHQFPKRGEPFILPPTNEITEIQSIFYPIEHPYKTSHYLQDILLFKPKAPLFVVFPAHEGEFIEFQREIWANIYFLHKNKSFKWLELSEMNKIVEQYRQ